ncbi:hypothetical protein SynBIOSE41_01063 [Synechococcus sp. BIOS-E4-1]|nr:hypothetical protein SynBIOSE41_01063 [Synechococcus sp. BIOS-E4-1]
MRRHGPTTTAKLQGKGLIGGSRINGEAAQNQQAQCINCSPTGER